MTSSKALNLNGKPTRHQNIKGHATHCNASIELHIRHDPQTHTYYISRRCTCGHTQTNHTPRHTTFTLATKAEQKSHRDAEQKRLRRRNINGS